MLLGQVFGCAAVVESGRALDAEQAHALAVRLLQALRKKAFLREVAGGCWRGWNDWQVLLLGGHVLLDALRLGHHVLATLRQTGPGRTMNSPLGTSLPLGPPTTSYACTPTCLAPFPLQPRCSCSSAPA